MNVNHSHAKIPAPAQADDTQDFFQTDSDAWQGGNGSPVVRYRLPPPPIDGGQP